MGDDDIDAKLDQFGGERSGAVAPSPCITPFDRDVLVFDIAEILQTSSEGIAERMWRRRGDQHPDTGQSFYLLWKCPTLSAKQSRGQYADENASVQRSSSSSPCGYCRAISREPRTVSCSGFSRLALLAIRVATPLMFALGRARVMTTAARD